MLSSKALRAVGIGCAVYRHEDEKEESMAVHEADGELGSCLGT